MNKTFRLLLLSTFFVPVFVSAHEEGAHGDDGDGKVAAIQEDLDYLRKTIAEKEKDLNAKLAASKADGEAKALEVEALKKALAEATEASKEDRRKITALENRLAVLTRRAGDYHSALEELRDRLADLGRSMGAGPLMSAKTGSGDHVYQVVPAWPKYPEGKSLGSLHGDVAADSAGKVYIAVGGTIQVIGADGVYERDLGDQWGGVHGMKVRKQDGEEFLFVAQTGAKKVAKLKLDGTSVLEIDGPPKVDGMYGDIKEYNPTDVDVTADGTIYIVDGYGKSLVHIYDKLGNYKTTFGGKGTENGKFDVCHNVIIDTRQANPTLLISDRQNNRLQLHAMDGAFIRTIDAELRQPCAADIYGDLLAVGELGGRLSLYDKDNKLLVRLGDEPADREKGNGAPPESWVDGALVAVHGCTFDANGDLYAQEWNRFGRLIKYTHVKQ
ncbi:MAG: hypothetical protein R3F19_24095 [Verrucomicrobiales bacterium]